MDRLTVVMVVWCCCCFSSAYGALCLTNGDQLKSGCTGYLSTTSFINR